MATEIQKAAENKPSPMQSLAQAIEQKQASFASVATRYLPPDRLVKLAQAAIARQPKLAECTTLSVLTQLMTCARLGLEPNEPGGVWLVPFRNKNSNRLECQSVIDYRGLIDVARRSGQIAAIHADVRRENDEWEFGVDTTSPVLVRLRHVPAEGDRGQTVGAYAVAKLANGQCHAVYLTQDEINSYRLRSRAKDSGPWQTDPAAMACKTACRRVVNLLPRTPEVQSLREALAQEEAIEAGEAIVPELPASRAESVKARLVERVAARPAEPEPEAEGEPVAAEEDAP